MTEKSNKTDYLESQWKKSTARRFARWFFAGPTLRKTAFILVGVITLIALFYAVENWRGARAWKRYAEDLRSRGEPIDYRDIIPPPVADESNFAATPFWSSLQYEPTMPDRFETNRWPDLWGPALSRSRHRENQSFGTPSRPLFERMDFPALAEAISELKTGTNQSATADLPPPTDADAQAAAARIVLREMENYRSVLDELRDARDRPESRFPVAYDTPDPWSILLPHLSKVKSVCVALQVDAKANLAIGNPDRAFDDVLLILKLSESVRSEPIVISYLVRLACLRIACSVVWEGQVLHLWEESHLRRLQERFASQDVIREAGRSLEGERAFANAFFEFLIERRRQSGFPATMDSLIDGSGAESFLVALAPRGWIQFEKVNYNLLFDQMLPNLSEPRAKDSKRINPGDIEANGQLAIDSMEDGSQIGQFLKHRLFARFLLPALPKVLDKTAQVQSMLDMTALACALERYRLQHGPYPTALADLATEFIDRIPLDVVSDEPYRYESLPDQRFNLYSIGWNETDDGGTDSTKDEERDWVWRFP